MSDETVTLQDETITIQWSPEILKARAAEAAHTAAANAALNKVQDLNSFFKDWVDNDDSAQTIIGELINHFGLQSSRRIEFKATLEVYGSIEVEWADEVDLNRDVDFQVSTYGSGAIDSVEVENIYEM